MAQEESGHSASTVWAFREVRQLPRGHTASVGAGESELGTEAGHLEVLTTVPPTQVRDSPSLSWTFGPDGGKNRGKGPRENLQFPVLRGPGWPGGPRRQALGVLTCRSAA